MNDQTLNQRVAAIIEWRPRTRCKVTDAGIDFCVGDASPWTPGDPDPGPEDGCPMGWEVAFCRPGDKPGSAESIPNFASDPTACEAVLEWLKVNQCSVKLETGHALLEQYGGPPFAELPWICRLEQHQSGQRWRYGMGKHPNRCQAVCLALVDAFPKEAGK